MRCVLRAYMQCVRVSMEASVCELVKSEDTNAIDSLFVLLFDHYLILQLLQIELFLFVFRFT